MEKSGSLKSIACKDVNHSSNQTIEIVNYRIRKDPPQLFEDYNHIHNQQI